jgi:hypothetical protein
LDAFDQKVKPEQFKNEQAISGQIKRNSDRARWTGRYFCSVLLADRMESGNADFILAGDSAGSGNLFAGIGLRE